MYKVFIVEDDPGITSAVTELCESWELQPVAVTDFRNIAAEFAAASPHTSRCRATTDITGARK